MINSTGSVKGPVIDLLFSSFLFRSQFFSRLIFVHTCRDAAAIVHALHFNMYFDKLVIRNISLVGYVGFLLSSQDIILNSSWDSGLHFIKPSH